MTNKPQNLTYEILPINTLPLPQFNWDAWYLCKSEYVLLFDKYWHIGRYSYTVKGKGRWKNKLGYVINPTHWCPLPNNPEV